MTAATTTGLAILVVDDEPQVAAELAEALRDEGYAVEAVNDAAAALDRLRQAPGIGVMISDVRMPGGDGLALTRDALALRGEALALEVILMTGHATLDDAIDAVRMGAFDFVRKPFRLQDIFAATGRAMARAGGRRRVAQTGLTIEDQAQDPSLRLDRTLHAGVAALRGLMHELRTPLVPILGYAELLEQHGGTPEVMESAAEIRRGAESLVATVDDLLTLAMLEQGSLVLSLERIDSACVARLAMQAEHSRAEAKGIALQLAPGAWPMVTADRTRLRQVLGVVLRLAVEMTPRGGRVVLRGASAAGETSLWVEGLWGRTTDAGETDAVAEDAWEQVREMSPLRAQLAEALVARHGGRMLLTQRARVALCAELVLRG